MDDKLEVESPQLERRHLTVLECDLVGSTALAYRLDPEKLRDLILAYQDCVLAWIKKLDGFFVQYAGDAIWVYFGYPIAREDDACRAIRAGMGMIEAVRSIKLHSEPLNVRIGIASGLCIVGNMRQVITGSVQNNFYTNTDNQITAIGNPPNLAARLQTLVEPGSVAVAEETRSLAGDLFEFEDLGFHKMKGFSENIKAWRVIGESDIKSRFQALRPKKQSPLIGRTRELNKIKGLWTEACKGHGQVIYLLGEPGIGKSRLLVSIAEDIVGIDYSHWWLHCSEHIQNSAFAPVMALIQSQAEFSIGGNKPGSVNRLVQCYPELDEDSIKLLAELLSIEGRYKSYIPRLSSDRRRENLYEVLIELIENACKNGPLLFIVEDAHWIDPSTQALLQRLILRLEKLSILLLITSRTVNENDESFLELSHVQNINIGQLERKDCFSLVNALWHDEKLPSQIANQIVNQTDGVPLFIEDVIFSMRYSGATKSVAFPNKDIAVPAKLSDHLMSRIDKLGNSKSIAQIGAVVGREFSSAIMEFLTKLSPCALNEKIQSLIDVGLVVESGSTSDKSFIFKHAMIRDVAYDSLLIIRRKKLHKRIATWLATERPSLGVSQPEIIAYHYENAEVYNRAIDYWLAAGRHCNRLSSYTEASIHLESAYRLISKLPVSVKRDRIELDIIIALGVAHAGAGGISGEDAGKAYEKARLLCKALDYPAEIFPVLAGAGSFYFIRSDYKKSRNIAEKAIRLSVEKSNPEGTIIGNRILGSVQFITGRLNLSNNLLQASINIYDKDPSFQRNHTLDKALDYKTTALCYLALINLVIGKVDTALYISQQSLIHSKNINLHSVNCALCYQSAIRHLRGDNAEIIVDVATRSLELALEEGYASWKGMSRLIKGEAFIQLRKTYVGMLELEQGVHEHSNSMAQTFLPLAQSILAKGYLATNQINKAIGLLTLSETLSIKTRQLWYLPEILRLHAELLLAQGQYKEAHDAFKKAWKLASRSAARLWQTKILYSMAENQTFLNMYKESYAAYSNTLPRQYSR